MRKLHMNVPFFLYVDGEDRQSTWCTPLISMRRIVQKCHTGKIHLESILFAKFFLKFSLPICSYCRNKSRSCVQCLLLAFFSHRNKPSRWNPFIFRTLLHLEMIKPVKIMTVHTLQLVTFLLTFQRHKERCKHAVELLRFHLHHVISWTPSAQLVIRYSNKWIHRGSVKGMCWHHIVFTGAVLTVMDFFRVWYSAHRTPSASLMKHRPTVAHFNQQTQGDLASEKGDRGQGKSKGEWAPQKILTP